MTATAHTPAAARAATNPMRGRARLAGVLYLLTFVSIPTLTLYNPIRDHADFILGAGSQTGVLWGAFTEVIVALAGIGTAVTLFPVVKRQNEGMALGFVAVRTLEAAMIFTGVLTVLAVYTLRHDFAGGTDTAAVTTSASALVAVKNWTFLLGPGIMPAVNALCFATIMYQSRLVPRWIPTLGLIGAPLLLASSTASLFGAWDQVSSAALVMALPIATWEFSVGVYMTVKGFRTPPAADADVRPAPAASLAHA